MEVKRQRTQTSEEEREVHWNDQTSRLTTHRLKGWKYIFPKKTTKQNKEILGPIANKFVIYKLIKIRCCW